MHVPVWHERTREARESGELVLVGITEEQHPDRCELFAKWQAFDWPILWDPFNLTESAAVPLAVGIDEHGIVRHVGMQVGQLDEFLMADFEAPAAMDRVQLGVREEAQGPEVLDPSAVLTADQALSRLLWNGVGEGSLAARDFEAAIHALEQVALADGAPASLLFRLGVALHMRHDSAAAQPADFQTSLDRWSAALAADPAQYIWRRRIQQWGPRLDKPYPFYDWVAVAERVLADRGTPMAVRVPLTSSEVFSASSTHADLERKHPDPEREVPRDTDGWVALDVAVVPHTGNRDDKKTRGVQIHLVLRPSSELDVHWGNEAGPTEIWIEHGAEYGIPGSAFVLQPPTEDASAETRRLDFTIERPPGVREVKGTMFYFVCEGREGECRFLAQDFELDLSELP